MTCVRLTVSIVLHNKMCQSFHNVPSIWWISDVTISSPMNKTHGDCIYISNHIWMFIELNLDRYSTTYYFFEQLFFSRIIDFEPMFFTLHFTNAPNNIAKRMGNKNVYHRYFVLYFFFDACISTSKWHSMHGHFQRICQFDILSLLFVYTIFTHFSLFLLLQKYATWDAMTK